MSAMVELRDVYKQFGATEVIRGVDLSVPSGETHAIIGPNGAGKSTLFNLITGCHRVSAGRVLLAGADITRLAPHEIHRRGLSRSFQVTNIFPRMSVRENIRCAVLWDAGYGHSMWHVVDRREDLRERTDQALEELGLTSRSEIPAGLLSYSDQRTLEIGITIAGGARVIMLDEPTSGMSRSETENAVALIRRLAEDRTVIIVEHDMGVVFDLADRISVLVYGRVIASETPEVIRSDEEVREAYLGTPVRVQSHRSLRG